MYPISEQVRECRQYAEHCAQNAQNQSDPELRQNYLEMQNRWLSLACSYEFSERLEFLSSVEIKNKEIRSVIGAQE
jgi:hypothetical protein